MQINNLLEKKIEELYIDIGLCIPNERNISDNYEKGRRWFEDNTTFLREKYVINTHY